METQETGADTAEGQRESPGYWQQLWSGASALTSMRTDKVHKDVQTGQEAALCQIENNIMIVCIMTYTKLQDQEI